MDINSFSRPIGTDLLPYYPNPYDMRGPEYIRPPPSLAPYYQLNDKLSMVKKYIDKDSINFDNLKENIMDAISGNITDPFRYVQIVPALEEIATNAKKLKKEQNTEYSDLVNIDTYKSNIKNAIDSLEYLITRPSY